MNAYSAHGMSTYIQHSCMNTYIQTHMYAYKQCTSIFGEEEGRLIWERTNDFFDTLPIAARIDNKVIYTYIYIYIYTSENIATFLYSACVCVCVCTLCQLLHACVCTFVYVHV
jgi:hypothetical protein